MWKYQQTDELYHYGVLGMKWGIRKAQKILSSSKSTPEQKRKAMSILDKHKGKINKKISKIDKSNTKLTEQRNKQIKSTELKEIAYRQEANRLRSKKYGLFTGKKKAAKLEYKATKLDVKADNLKYQIEKTKAKIAKNSKMKAIFSSGLDQVQSLSEKGKKYLNTKK